MVTKDDAAPVTAEDYDPEFVEAWIAQEEAGYIYSESNIAKVYMGWQLARQSLPASEMQEAINEALAFYDALGHPHAPGEAEILDKLDRVRRKMPFARHRGSTAGVDEVRRLLDSVGGFLDDFAQADLDEGAADAVTVGMVYQQQAQTVVLPRIRAALASLSQTPATPMVQEGLREALVKARRALSCYRCGGDGSVTTALGEPDECPACHGEDHPTDLMREIDRALSATPAQEGAQ